MMANSGQRAVSYLQNLCGLATWICRISEMLLMHSFGCCYLEHRSLYFTSNWNIYQMLRTHLQATYFLRNPVTSKLCPLVLLFHVDYSNQRKQTSTKLLPECQCTGISFPGYRFYIYKFHSKSGTHGACLINLFELGNMLKQCQLYSWSSNSSGCMLGQKMLSR